MKRRLVVAVLMALLTTTFVPSHASAAACTPSGSHAATGFDGVTYVSVQIDLTTSGSAGDCYYSYYMWTYAWNGAQVWAGSFNIRIWVCGTLIENRKIYGWDPYYNLGSYHYGNCGPQADDYATAVRTQPGSFTFPYVHW
jgi:hypothetical protein